MKDNYHKLTKSIEKWDTYGLDECTSRREI